MEKEALQKELQLLPPPPFPPPPPSPPPSTFSHALHWFPDKPSTSHHTPSKAPPFDLHHHYHHHLIHQHQGPSPSPSSSSLDLQLSISLQPIGPMIRPNDPPGCIQALKGQASEQIRLAALEKAYAERVRELTRREMELAQAEFARARLMWERAKEEVAKAEKMKENATRQTDSSCLEITCHSCRQRFRP
ncbi:hypothetical protein Ancab_035595 [Ancistrocladus abbreviatus]